MAPCFATACCLGLNGKRTTTGAPNRAMSTRGKLEVRGQDDHRNTLRVGTGPYTGPDELEALTKRPWTNPSSGAAALLHARTLWRRAESEVINPSHKSSHGSLWVAPNKNRPSLSSLSLIPPHSPPPPSIHSPLRQHSLSGDEHPSCLQGRPQPCPRHLPRLRATIAQRKLDHFLHS